MPSASRPLLLDTHYWLWLAAGDWRKFPSRTKKLVESAAVQGSIFISAISVWEAGVLEQKGRIRLGESASSWLRRVCEIPGLQIAPLSPEIAWESSHLPGIFHGDPADRIIVATARVLKARLLTKDAAILEYGAERFVDIVNF